MSIQSPRVPPKLERIFLEAIGKPPDVVEAYPLYVLNTADLLQGGDAPPRARIAAWQFLARIGDRIVAGDVPYQSGSARGDGPSLIRGPAIESAWNASQKVRATMDARRGDFDLRRLRLPGLRIEAFWAKALPADDFLREADLAYPYVTFQRGWKNRLLDMAVFVKTARASAAERAKYVGTPKPPKKSPALE